MSQTKIHQWYGHIFHLGEEVTYTDCEGNLLDDMDLVTREVFLPLLCCDESQVRGSSVSADNLLQRIPDQRPMLSSYSGSIGSRPGLDVSRDSLSGRKSPGYGSGRRSPYGKWKEIARTQSRTEI